LGTVSVLMLSSFYIMLLVVYFSLCWKICSHNNTLHYLTPIF